MRSRDAYVVAGALGLLVYFVVYGPGHLFGTSTYWDMPQDDSRAYLMGYRYFLHEPWGWPLATTHTINVPFAKSMALSDGIPIWAFVNKGLATIVPPWREVSARAYLGTWHLVTHVLQPCLGVAILRQFGHRSRGASILGAVFFLALPTWIFRYQHAALDAHFLILWPIYLYLRTPARAVPSTRLQLAWVAELAICAMTNPYHVVMSFGMFGAALIRSRRLRTLAWIPAVLAAIAVAAWLAGYLSHVTATPMGGFEIYSSNVTSMFVPPNSTILGDARRWFGDIPPIWNQYEGQVYLGLGLVALSALFLPQVRTLGRVIERHVGLFAFALAMFVFALSNHIYFNSTRLLAFEYPKSLQFVTVLFRAPGRFAWVPMYVLIVFLLQWGMRRYASGWRRLVLPALAVVQIIDASGSWRDQHANTRSPFKHTLALAPWKQLVAAHDAVFELPTYDCMAEQWRNLPAALEIAYDASDHAISINGVYGARPVRDCVEDRREFPAIVPAANALYIWFTKSDHFARRMATAGATCAAFEFGRVCSTNAAAIASAISAGILAPMPASSDAPVLADGQVIAPGTDGTPQFLDDGWSWSETGGRWTDGAFATLRFRFARPLAHAVMKLNAAAVICGRRKTEDVDVLINDANVATLHFDAGANDAGVTRVIPIPDAALGNELVIDFKPHDTRPPSTVRCNGDTRHTGMWLGRLWFEPQP